MGMIDTLVTDTVNSGIGFLLSRSPVDAATASKALILAGQAQIDLGDGLADGSLTQEEIDKVLADINGFEGGVFGTMVKSSISRLVEQFATKK